MKRWIIVSIILALVAVVGVGTLSAQAGADQYRAAGDQSFAAKDYAKAYQYYAYAVKMNPNDAAALKGAGNCLYMYRRPAQALVYYKKSLALNPGDAQLAAFVQKLEASSAAAPAAAPAASSALAQGAALLKQKQPTAAIPYFQQAIQQNPNDYQGYYYLGYAQYMAGDRKNAAVNFGLANAKRPTPQLKAYADRIKASLPPADQQWVDAQIAGGGAVQKADAGIRAKKFGIRFYPGIALYKLDDIEAEGAALEAECRRANDADDDPLTVGNEMDLALMPGFGTPGMYALTGDVPKGNLFVGSEIFLKPSPALDIALGLGIFPVGKYSVDITSPNFADPDLTDSIRKAYDISAMPIGLSFGYAMGKGKVQPRLSLGADYYSVKVKETFSIVTGDTGYGYTGDYKCSGVGFHVDFGLDFKFGSSVTMGPVFRYRMAKFDEFTGTVTADDETYEATLMVDEDSDLISPVETGEDADGMRNMEIDLGGLQIGLGVAVLF